jgi:CTD small phosphatase-like protein 2
LFRDSCIYTDERVYVKDLRILGNRNLQDVILVDNAAYSFGFQVENGVPIIPFYDDKNDQELKHLTTYLKSLCDVKDVREVNKKTFKLHLYANYNTPQEVIENVVLMN